MKAIIYTRVASEHVSNPEKSIAGQKSKLQAYCKQNNIEIVGIHEDFASSYTFHRFEWLKIMRFLKDSPGTADYILITTWDRFSRSIEESCIMIKELKKLGVKLQAIDQPLDFVIPGSAIMFASYVARPTNTPDKRRKRLINSVRMANKEGRWIGYSLKGYKKVTNSYDKTIMVPDGGKMEALVKRAFSEFASGKYSPKLLFKKLNKEGLKSKNVKEFERMLKNRGYIGQIFVQAFKDEPATWVRGLHTAIIDEETFYKVQEILGKN